MTVIDEDELFSMKAASVVMLLISVLTLGMRFGLGTPFFNSIVFDASIVYVPTILLLVFWLRERTLRTSA